MLGKIDLNCSLDKTTYKSEIDELEKRLLELQQKIISSDIPILIVFEGWSASGKGTLISKILYPLDPRYYNVFTMSKISEDIAMRPFLWNYWIKTPSRGRITIFDKSWHRLVLPEMQKKRVFSPVETDNFYYDIDAFEKQLSDDGTLIIKFFLHISKEEQRKRFDELLKNNDTRWRVNDQDIKQNENYSKHLEHFEDMINKSKTDKWNIIEANDSNYATIKIYKLIINEIETEIAKRLSLKKIKANSIIEPLKPEQDLILNTVNPNKVISKKDYKNQLKYYQNKLSHLGHSLYTKRKSVVIVYEGWDAAGKGGNIRRLTQKLDPRSYEVVPIAAPSKEELWHHYMWRFWKSIPKDGHFAIFDRSWYGRVLVERIENLCSEEEWQRAYKEINDMESHLINHGTIIFKFWLHIDNQEQLERFKSREADPLKEHKITEEDWRNRDKWPEYEKAVNEMLFRTSTKYAPWTVIESNNKKYARVKILKLVTDVLEKKIK